MHARRRTVGAALAALAVVAGLTGPGTQAAPSTDPAADPLRARLTAILGDSRLDGASAALTVRDLDSDETLFRSFGSTRLLPASNTKLLTSAAALDVLGPDHRFVTDVLATGARRGGTLRGDLYLRGTGDPTIMAADYDRLAADVARSGVRSVTGRLVADDSWFDATPLAPFWSWDDEPYHYSAQTSALTVAPNTDGDAGTVLVDVHPGRRPGAAPRVTMTPANHYLHIRNRATTGTAGSDTTVSLVREHGRNVVDVTGSIPAGGETYEDQPTVDRPTGLAAQLFARALAHHGVRIRAGARHAVTPSAARPVASHRSITLAALLTPFLKLSNNMMAEALVKTMGRTVSGEGSWSAGTAAVLAELKRLGLDTSTLQLFDGSGLGRADYATTDQLAVLLDAARDKPWFATWYAALPVAGDPDRLVGGTLRNRMVGTAAAGNVHAKTGSMTGVSALSGYVTDAAGHHLGFAMITNNAVAGGVSSLEDAVAVTLAEHGAAARSTPRVRVAPASHAPTGPRAQLECTWTRSC
ncbi:D-alanyl-D-alanine carboxypeptidase / D-alanyl-D-alanine-endopeptidase (penicillin-binding protein 4) [Jatrophihabitans endophyticus]|uniref:D-alanyl-D-alanine carboxypeptidase / D-alanyl-D-alanine-endopeptidase (Penicillin-binding protein 4) n=1 Tax=Jatrophihabitans endophyticus TaxID=1206085 RepID=A0A1M5P5M0_9ACTN|nr:D-alanyl-D-alanine carboxypeptidase/D-alanyl-D-alanine-endopeptidase [Jatrophihabitans endophyticus]SHG97086.1 D-alanyl-D-alanine carboxypeptidase / D-alanyl-D-alanine-endopeptidase (penicillin-binding protein 4) [Jatrophihabitans endophyticus]